MEAKNRFNFTKKAIQKLPVADKGKRPAYFDTQMKNLCVTVTDKGSKIFWVRKVIEGRSRRVRLGAFPDLSIENAREMALEVKNQIAKGGNPFEHRQRFKLEPTFSQMFAQYLEKHAKPYKKPSSLRADEYNFHKYIDKDIGHIKLSAVTGDDIQRLHSKTAKNHGKYVANRILALVRIVFSKAIEWNITDKKNPASHIKPFKEHSRDRFLQKDELPRFIEALEAEPNRDIRDYVWVSLLTGARRGNVQAMRWKDISLDRMEWRIEDTKNNEPQVIPLVPFLCDLLSHRKKQNKNGSPFVFASRGKTGHLTEPKSGWKRILKRANIDNFRIHDLRRTSGSYQAALGTSLPIIGKSLGHKSLAATQIYSRLDIDPVRDSLTQTADVILALGKKNA
ncbi:MAG: site-specific integrase [Rickettsiales bacterium]|nr:site-specific integrase [Rickettsiales bacterium]